MTFLGVFGHTAVDIILQVDDLPEPDTSTPVKDRVRRFGGTAANISKNVSDLDVPVALASFVGQDFPDDFRSWLADSGVDITDLDQVEGYSTPRCWIVGDPEEKQMAFIDQGPMEDAGRFEVQDYALRSSEVIHIGTGRPEYYEKVIKEAQELGKEIGFDPAQELRYVYSSDVFRRLFSKCDFFFCNEVEFEIAKEYLDIETLDEMTEDIEALIVTKGDEGSTLYTEGGEIDIPPFDPENVIDPTGAGDAYRAGFYSGLYRGMGLEKCCYLASARASFAVEFSGPQEGTVRWEDVIERMEDQDSPVTV